jgi:hypothetical protein
MLIFSLGRTLQRIVKSKELEEEKLKGVLESMVRPNPAARASLMDLFDVSTTATSARTCAVCCGSLPRCVT